MRYGFRILYALSLALVFTVPLWSHGGDLGGSRTQRSRSVDPEQLRRDELESLQVKIDRLDRKLENPRLSPEKRVKLEKKLEQLLSKKNALLDGSR
jgi:predicted RNase H-like nuclease (RuvC/YqgF family)